ncbi:MAG: DUF2284 domain-containing protein [Clostridiaceae bacterium]
MELNEFNVMAKKLGAEGSKIIDTDTIITAPWTILKCRYGCPNYNTSPCCPPLTPTYKEMQEVIDCYKKAILINTKKYDKTTGIIVKLEREIFLTGFYKAFGLGSGSCKLCTKCNKEKCNNKVDARPSMEACGIDVFQTAKNNGFNIEVLNDKEAEQNSYGIVLIE